MYVRRYKAKEPKIDDSVIMFLFVCSIIIVFAKIGLIIGAVLFVCATIYEIVKFVQHAIAAKEKKERALVQKKEFLHSAPPAIKKRTINKKTAGYLEVENIRSQFETFVKEEDVVIWKKSYLDWLMKKSAIQRELSIETESQQELNAKMVETRTELEALESDLRKYAMRWYKLPWMKEGSKHTVAFAPLKNNLNPKSESETLNRFLINTPKAFYSGFQECEYIFTPLFILKYEYIGMEFQLIEYRNIDVSIYIDTVLRENGRGEFDEIAFFHWDYERKDGGPDLRYKNNQRTTYIYKGTVFLHIGSDDIKFSFPNKTLAKNFEEQIREFLDLTTKKPYCDDIESLINGVGGQAYESRELNAGAELSVSIIKPGLAVIHDTFGKGKISQISDRYMTVDFWSCGSKKFKYPEAVQSVYFRLDEDKERNSGDAHERN